MELDSKLKKIGKIISKIRKEKELSQGALGELAQCSQMTIQRIEHGTRGGVRLESLLTIADALNLSLADVFFETEQGEAKAQKSKSRWEYLSERIERMNPSIRDWICDFLEKILDKPWQ
ncbi:MAG: helix-turn-helix transcriptional regulator [Gammaproteobacteria bacterium]|nr:helix-turn-helix transcriptional regulator [Gammaproteobacteria bacterium]